MVMSFRWLTKNYRWDSSDPDRAPPPLPLNPVSPSVGVPTSRTGTSLAIQNAHAALTEKARENALVPVIHKRNTDFSPERGLVQRTSPHKRMQSLQPGSVRDLSLMIEAGRDSANSTPRGSPEKEKFARPATPVRGRDYEKEVKSIEKDPSNIGSISIPQNLTPTMRPAPRWPQPSILGENTPPQSATMLALHNMATPPARETESPLATVTNNAAAQPRAPTSHEQLSSQLLTLTNIATQLQKEMSALSRRSRDNATDLMSLKEATHARDEDIRKSLRELASNVDPTKYHRDPYNGGLYLDNKAYNNGGSPVQKHARPYGLPRVPSPNSFAASLDRESILSTPSLVGSETPATMALLEKIIREMSTKDGQDMMLDRLAELAERLSGMASATKVEELVDHLRNVKQEQAIVHVAGNSSDARSLSFGSTSEDSVGDDWKRGSGAMGPKVDRLLTDKEPPRPSNPNLVLSEDFLSIIRSVKDSVAQGGGLTAEVKALVRELRGEVLGMGRELGRKLEESGAKSSHAKGDTHSKSETASRAELARIVEEGLEQMKVYMQQRLREHRRESTESTKSVIDYQEIYNAMRTALADSQAETPQEKQASREDVLNAVKEAWENYKPEIEIQQVGLERDEVLACIKEGLEGFTPQHETVTKEEVFAAVVEGMKHFETPKIDASEALSRDEVLDAVRECLEEFEFPVAPSALGNDLSREDMLHAVKQGLGEFNFPNSNTALVPHESGDSEIMERLHDVMQYMQDEFKALSEQAKKHLATNERDTEQVLDATKDGFENLRTQIEEYVDRVSENNGGAGQEELMSNLINSFDNFRDELGEMISKTSDSSRDLVKQELESLRDAVNSSLVPHVPPPADNREALEAIREGLDRVRSDLLRPHAGTTDILDALHEGFGEMRACIDKINDKPVDLTANDEILDALKSGLDDVRADIDTLRGSNDNKAMVALNQDHSDALIPTDLVKHDDIKNLEVIMSDLRVKMESMALTHPGQPALPEGALSKEDLAQMEEILRNGVSKEDLNEMEQRLQNGLSRDDLSEMKQRLENGLSKEDLAEMEERLQGGLSKADLEEMEQRLQHGLSKEDLTHMQEMLQNGVSKEDLNQMEEILRGLQKSMAAMTGIPIKVGERAPPINPDDAATKEDVQAIENILRNTKSRLDDLIDGEQAVRKDHVDAVEALVLETKDSFESFAAQLETITRKDDLITIESLVTQITVAVDEMKERAEKYLEDPEKVTKSHVDSINVSIADMKALLETLSNTGITKDDLNQVEEVVREIKDYNTNDLPSKEDLKTVEDVVKSIKDHNESILPSKEDLKIVEDFVREIKEQGAVLPSRDDLKNVEDIVTEIKDHSSTLPSRDDLKNVEDMIKEIKEYNAAQEEANSTALATRHAEVVTVNERVADVKAFLEEFQSVVKDRLHAGGSGVETLGRMLEGLGETINQNATVGSDLKEMFQVMKTEFEESKSGMAGAKLDSDEKLKEAANLLGEKIDGKIGALVTKYEEFQLVIEDRTKAGEARDAEMEAAVVGNKAVADELKVLIDTLGSTVTDSLEKMEEASKTVFEKVETLFTKSEDNHAEGKAEHEMTREQVKQAIGAVEGLQGHVSDYQPKILEAVKDVLLIVGQHYAHSKTSVTDIQQFIEEAKPSSLKELMPPVEKYDDTSLHTKLDKLIDHTHASGKAYSQLDTLDKVHQQVVKTAADISEFLSSQKQRIENEHDDREKTLQETTIALECQKAEQELVTATLATLRDEESQLRESILTLRTEQEFLTRQKTRLTADVSSLETALHLRREELHAMDVRAEGLERRILEGVLDHSRALLITKSSAKGRDAMSRKRVARSGLGVSEQGSKSRSGATMAVNGNRTSLIQPNPAGGANRRILSLTQMTNNVPTGGLKRSQSVRTPAATSAARKGSWPPGRGGKSKGYGDLDKENVDSVREMDEEGHDEDEAHVSAEEDDSASDPEDDHQEALNEQIASEANTLRRASPGAEGSDNDYDSASDESLVDVSAGDVVAV